MADPELERFFREHFAIIRAKCTRMLGEVEEAADVAQETFARLCESGAIHQAPAERLRWIYVTSTHLAIDLLRRRKLGVVTRRQGDADERDADPPADHPHPDGACRGGDDVHWLIRLDAPPDAEPTSLPTFEEFLGGVERADGSLAGLLFRDAEGCFVLAASGAPATLARVGGAGPCFVLDRRPGGAWVSTGGWLLRLDAATLMAAAPGGAPITVDDFPRASDDSGLYFLHADAAGLAAWRARHDGRAAAARVGEVPGAFTLSVTETALVASVKGDAAAPAVLLALPKAGGTAIEIYRSPVAQASLLAVETTPGSDQVFLTDAADGTAAAVGADGGGLARFGDRSLASAFSCGSSDAWRPAGRRCLLAEASDGLQVLRSFDAANGHEVARLGELPARYADGLRSFEAAGTLALVQVFAMSPRGFGLLLVDTEQAGSAVLVSEGLVPIWSPW